MSIKADDGYFFGLGLFETINLVRGHCMFLSEHLQRLNDSLAFFALPQPLKATDVYAYLEQNHHENGALKITVSPQNTLFSLKDNPYDGFNYKEGMKLTFSNIRQNETSPFTYHKTLNRAEKQWEKTRGAAAGYDEIIFLNSQGEICEGAVSNIFFVKEGGIFTPQVSCGLLNGIVRQYLCRQYEVTEIGLTPHSLSYFEECFITNSLMGIMPVKSLQDTVFPRHDLSLRLKKAYESKKLFL